MSLFNTIVLSHVNTKVLDFQNNLRFNTRMTFAERFIKARHHAQLSQTELALRLGCTQGLISKIERGDQNETALIVKMANLCKVNPFWLDSGDGAMIEPLYNLSNQQSHVLKAMQNMDEYQQTVLTKITNSLVEPEKPNGTK